MSKGSARLGNNLRAAATATKQGGNDVHQVHWAPDFAKGRLRIYVCDAEQTERNPLLPDKLNDGENLAKCVRTVIPHILEEMRDAYGWRTSPMSWCATRRHTWSAHCMTTSVPTFLQP